MSSTFGRRIEPGFGPASKSVGAEPASSPPDAVPIPRPQAHSVPIGIEQNANERWDATFARMREGEKGFYTFSFLGLVFGPLYYMYLRMWRMAFAIIGFWFIGIVVTEIIEHVTSIGLGRLVGPVTYIFCRSHVKKDYFHFKCANERFWPRLDSLAGTGALVAMIIVPIGVAAMINATSTGLPTEASSTSRQTAPTNIISSSSGSDNNLTIWRLPIEAEGGTSGDACAMIRLNVPQILQYRASGYPIDLAKNVLVHDNWGIRAEIWMSGTIEEGYKDPSHLKDIVRSGYWSHLCVKYVSGT